VVAVAAVVAQTVVGTLWGYVLGMMEFQQSVKEGSQRMKKK
jgi:hypothetical protein